MKLSISNSLTPLERDRWDRLAATRSFYASSYWVKFQESIEECRATFVCVWNEGELVAAVPVFVLDRPGSSNYTPSRLFEDVDGSSPTVLAGGTRGYCCGLLLDARLSDVQRLRVLERLQAGVEEIVSEANARTAWWLYVTSSDAALLKGYGNVTPRLLKGDCVIDLPKGGFDAYLENLSGSGRRHVRRDLKAFESSAFTVRRVELSEYVPECGSLLARSLRKHGQSVSDEQMQSWLAKACAASGDRSTVYSCHDADGIVGFALHYTFGETTCFRASGFDYSRLRDGAEYFQLAFYEPIREGYATGVERLHLGTGAYQGKVRRGASVAPVWAVPTGADAWDGTATARFNAARAEALRSAMPEGKDLVWDAESANWLI